MIGYNPLEDVRLLDIDAYLGRLHAFCVMAGLTSQFTGMSVLVIGSALGGESIAAHRMRAALVVGLDVDPALITRSREIAQAMGLSSLQFISFGGDAFPALEPVDIVLSGHVIEHTASPSLHLDECLRALKPSGYLFLEFPTRFHRRELHTGLISFEWLPKPLRNGLNSLAGWVSSIGHHDAASQRVARHEINHELRQISTIQIRLWLRGRAGAAIIKRDVPAPGIVRLCIRKVDNNAMS